MANNTTNLSQSYPLETRIQSRQTSAAHRARTTEPVPDPEQLLRQTQNVQRTKSAIPTLSTANTTIYHMLKLGSPSNCKPNPFIKQTANRSGPSFPGLLDISKVSEPPATIIEELALKEDLLEEASIPDPTLLSNNSNSTQPQV